MDTVANPDKKECIEISSRGLMGRRDWVEERRLGMWGGRQNFHNRPILFFFIIQHVHTGEWEGGFELVTSASLGMVHSQLSYPLETTTVQF